MKTTVNPRIIAELWEIICDRADNPKEGSYTTRLLTDEKGIDKILEKVGEESTEFILAIKNGTSGRTAGEAADLIFHILVALRASGVDLSDVMDELGRRRK